MFGLLSAAKADFFTEIGSFFDFVKNAFLNIGIPDIVDILLLTAIFFFSARVFRNRKVGALLAGIAICLVGYACAWAFGLSGVEFLLAAIFKIGALALIIIFQPEIRELLERVGNGSLKGIRTLGDKNVKKKMHYKTVDSVCLAVQMLSVERTGALIVIERTTRLEDIISSGTRLDAEVSDSLIRNIFFDKAPLHDGAVIISEGRITAAACILPLPKHTIVSGDLGTRHRAAVGLGEISDAITVIVSEQTGIISVVNEGELIRNFTASTLKKYLFRELINENPTSEEI